MLIIQVCLNRLRVCERRGYSRGDLHSIFHIIRMSLLTNENQVRGVASYYQLYEIERFPNDCPKTNTKVITPTNHNRSEQRDEPITVPSNYL